MTVRISFASAVAGFLSRSTVCVIRVNLRGARYCPQNWWVDGGRV